MTSTRKTTKRTETFTDEERAAMKERAQELKTSARRSSRADKAAEEEAAVVAKIAEMQDSDRVMAERIHAVVKASAPDLAPKLWYGMPAVRQGRQGRLFLPERAEVQRAVRDLRLQRQGEPRRGHDVADRLRAHEAHRGGRGADR